MRNEHTDFMRMIVSAEVKAMIHDIQPESF